jgi:hypothetical protein
MFARDSAGYKTELPNVNGGWVGDRSGEPPRGDERRLDHPGGGRDDFRRTPTTSDRVGYGTVAVSQPRLAQTSTVAAARFIV